MLCARFCTKSLIPLLTEKKMHDLKAESYVLFRGLTEDLSPGDSLSGVSKGVREGPGYTGVL